MAFVDMYSELSQAIPSLSRQYAKTLINRSWRIVRDANLWSFQLQNGGFQTAGILSAGSVTAPTLPIPPYIIGDAAASAAWANITWPPITTYQFRIQGYSIYNIIAYDTTSNPPFGTLTLDRPFVDPLPNAVGNGYQMFTTYIPAPTPTFKRWLSVMDMFDGYPLDIWTPRQDINILDPERFQTSDPTVICGMGTDQRQGTAADGSQAASATLGWQLFELWPTASAQISYQTWYVDAGADLVNPSDTLPQPITEDLILAKARVYAYEWAEARKDVMAARGSGANYGILMKQANDWFYALMKQLRLEDKDRVDAFNSRLPGGSTGQGVGTSPYYNTVTSRASMGWPWR